MDNMTNKIYQGGADKVNDIESTDDKNLANSAANVMMEDEQRFPAEGETSYDEARIRKDIKEPKEATDNEVEAANERIKPDGNSMDSRG